jgi:hypothetical protein
VYHFEKKKMPLRLIKDLDDGKAFIALAII